MSNRGIKKIQFYAIRRSIKETKQAGSFSIQAIAAKHNVSRETVRRVRDAKTWQAWLDLKSGRRAAQPAAAPKKSAKAIKPLVTEAPVQYVTFADLQEAVTTIEKVTQGVVDAIAKDIASVNEKATKALQAAKAAELSAKEAQTVSTKNARILSRIQQLKPRWFRDR